MQARTATLIGLALFGSLLLATGHMVTEGALFSRGFHEWRIDISADGPEDWRVDVPMLAAENASAAEDLAKLLDELRVERGNATFVSDGHVVHVEGSGDVTLLARRDFWAMTPAHFGDWRATGGNATRLDFHPPAEVYVTWRISHDGGGGHTCGGEGTWRAIIPAGGRAPLTMETMTQAGVEHMPLRASEPPLQRWCH